MRGALFRAGRAALSKQLASSRGFAAEAQPSKGGGGKVWGSLKQDRSNASGGETDWVFDDLYPASELESCVKRLGFACSF